MAACVCASGFLAKKPLLPDIPTNRTAKGLAAIPLTGGRYDRSKYPAALAAGRQTTYAPGAAIRLHSFCGTCHRIPAAA